MFSFQRKADTCSLRVSLDVHFFLRLQCSYRMGIFQLDFHMENEDILYGGNDEQEGEHLSDMAACSPHCV